MRNIIIIHCFKYLLSVAFCHKPWFITWMWNIIILQFWCVLMRLQFRILVEENERRRLKAAVCFCEWIYRPTSCFMLQLPVVYFPFRSGMSVPTFWSFSLPKGIFLLLRGQLLVGVSSLYNNRVCFVTESLLNQIHHEIFWYIDRYLLMLDHLLICGLLCKPCMHNCIPITVTVFVFVLVEQLWFMYLFWYNSSAWFILPIFFKISALCSAEEQSHTGLKQCEGK